MKTKTITLTLTDKEVDAVEDALWVKTTDEWWDRNRGHLSSFWRKLASAFDEEE